MSGTQGPQSGANLCSAGLFRKDNDRAPCRTPDDMMFQATTDTEVGWSYAVTMPILPSALLPLHGRKTAR